VATRGAVEGSRQDSESRVDFLDRFGIFGDCHRVDDVLDVIYMINFDLSAGRRPCGACACPG